MKKIYIAPSMEVTNIDSVSMIAASLNVYNTGVDTSKEGVQLGNKHRGEWGNIWNE